MYSCRPCLCRCATSGFSVRVTRPARPEIRGAPAMGSASETPSGSATTEAPACWPLPAPAAAAEASPDSATIDGRPAEAEASPTGSRCVTSAGIITSSAGPATTEVDPTWPSPTARVEASRALPRGSAAARLAAATRVLAKPACSAASKRSRHNFCTKPTCGLCFVRALESCVFTCMSTSRSETRVFATRRNEQSAANSVDFGLSVLPPSMQACCAKSEDFGPMLNSTADLVLADATRCATSFLGSLASALPPSARGPDDVNACVLVCARPSVGEGRTSPSRELRVLKLSAEASQFEPALASGHGVVSIVAGRIGGGLLEDVPTRLAGSVAGTDACALSPLVSFVNSD
mmetsp:Transcript_155293/g.498286  ORF Transcript_155293/g.498286 Transcript_155293/m.498286 type:complete len:348 (-) Transcript_155293:396-1439(-)